MTTLKQSDREHLCRQLMAAMLPSRADEIRTLEHAAFRAVLISYYTANGLRRIAGLPPHWLCKIETVLVKPSGQPHYKQLSGPGTLLPGEIDKNYSHDAKAQAAIDTWTDAKTADNRERTTLAIRLHQLLAGCRTLPALLDRLPEARDLLHLPPVETDDAIAESVRATLRGRAA